MKRICRVATSIGLSNFIKDWALNWLIQVRRFPPFGLRKGGVGWGLWLSEHTKTPYHPSIRHVALYVELEDIKRVQEWLRGRGIHPRADFGVAGEDQPLILENGANYHAAIYFDDPDGNSLGSLRHSSWTLKTSLIMTA